jgi:hypothetical protein
MQSNGVKGNLRRAGDLAVRDLYLGPFARLR